MADVRQYIFAFANPKPVSGVAVVRIVAKSSGDFVLQATLSDLQQRLSPLTFPFYAK